VAWRRGVHDLQRPTGERTRQTSSRPWCYAGDPASQRAAQDAPLIRKAPDQAIIPSPPPPSPDRGFHKRE